MQPNDDSKSYYNFKGKTIWNINIIAYFSKYICSCHSLLSISLQPYILRLICISDDISTEICMIYFLAGELERKALKGISLKPVYFLVHI